MKEPNNKLKRQQANINLNIDSTPVLFSDFAIWNISSDGIVINYAQKVIGSNQLKIISRIAMTKDFATKLLSEISQKIALAEVQGQTGKQTN